MAEKSIAPSKPLDFAALREQHHATISQLNEDRDRRIADLKRQITAVEHTATEAIARAQREHEAEIERRYTERQRAAHAALLARAREYVEADGARPAARALVLAWREQDALMREAVGEGLSEWPLVHAFADLQIERDPSLLSLFCQPGIWTHGITNRFDSAARFRRAAASDVDPLLCFKDLAEIELVVARIVTEPHPRSALPIAEQQRHWDILRFGGSQRAQTVAFEAIAAEQARQRLAQYERDLAAGKVQPFRGRVL